MPNDTPAPSSRCPCLSGFPYTECCGPLHHGETTAITAEQLMRSRYSAFVLDNAFYLLETWHSSTRPAALELATEVRWYRLDILGTWRGGVRDSTGSVEFLAYHRSPAGHGTQHEFSRFVKEHQRWYYVDGR